MVLSSIVGFDLPPLMLVAAALVVILVVRSLNQTPANLPPFPGRAYPIVGHLPLLGHEVRQKLLQISRETGGIFSLYLGRRLVIVLSGYDVLKEALLKQADNFSGRPFGGPLPVIGISDGILSTYEARWKENRAVGLRILKDFGVGQDVMSDKIIQEVSCYLNLISNLSGKATNMKYTTMGAVSNLVCSLLFGKRFNYNDKVFVDMLHVFDEFMSLAGENNLHQWIPELKYIPGDLFKSQRLVKLDNKIMSTMNNFIERVVQGDEELNDKNFISAYIEQLKQKQEAGDQTELSMKQLERVLFDLVLGGTETTSASLLWFYLYMINFPDIQEKFYQEIVTVIGTNRTPTRQDKYNLHYVNAVIMETQRLSSISPYSILHRCTNETTLQGYTIPKDVTVFVHIDAPLLDDNIWGDAHNFRPERFIREGKLYCPEEFVAFGMGRRACMGEFLARMELFLFTVSVVQRFRIAPADPDCIPPRTYTNGITCPPTPFQVRFIERDMH